jgi:hypothetical protein
MIKNTIYQHILPYNYSLTHLFDQKKVFDELISVWRWRRFLYTCGRAVVVIGEETSVEVVLEETGSSGIDGSGGDQRSREQQSREQWRFREFYDESEMTRGRLLFIGSKTSTTVLN